MHWKLEKLNCKNRFNDRVGQMQSILGTANDVGSAIFSVDSDYDLLNATDKRLNHWDRQGHILGLLIH